MKELENMIKGLCEYVFATSQNNQNVFCKQLLNNLYKEYQEYYE